MNKHVVFLYPLFLVCNCFGMLGWLRTKPQETAPTETIVPAPTASEGTVISSESTTPKVGSTTSTDERGTAVNVTVEHSPRIEIYHSPQHTISAAAQANSASQATSSSSLRARFNVWLEQKVDQVLNFPVHDVARSMQSRIVQHKRKLFLTAAGCAYITISALFLYGNHVVNQGDCWARWKKQLSLEEMQQFSQDELGKNLICDIQKRHVNIQNPTDHITPLVRFIQAVESEQRLLKRYNMLARIITLFRLTRLFPTNAMKIERIHEAHRRLMFVKHIFISWTAADNLKNFSH